MARTMQLFSVLLVTTLVQVACSKPSLPESAHVQAADEASLTDTPSYPDLVTLSDMLESGATTSARLVADALMRAREHAELNAFISLDAERATSRAAEIDRLRAAGQSPGRLSGIPLVAKDNIHVAGMRNTAGTPALKGFVPEESNEVVSRLQRAGGIIIGKTNMHELAFGVTTDNAAFGAARNPYDEALLPGGSSGGTAVAVSAGIVAAGLGTDTGGSVRIPAALTGIVGFRPSTGRYPSEAVTPASHTRDTIGLIARKVSDLTMLDEIIVPDSSPLSPVPASAIRLGVPREYFYQNLDPELGMVVEHALATLSQAGVELVEADVPDVGSLVAQTSFQIAGFEMVRDLPDYLETFSAPADFEQLLDGIASPDVQRLMQWVTGPDAVSEDAYTAGLAARERLRQAFEEYFDSRELDAIVFPTTQLPARPIEGSGEAVELNGASVPTFLTYIRNTEPASIAALPAISLPAGVTASGLPVGMEIDGPEGSDRHLLAVAQTLETILGFKGRQRRQVHEQQNP